MVLPLLLLLFTAFVFSIDVERTISCSGNNNILTEDIIVKFDKISQDAVSLFYPKNILSKWSYSEAYLGPNKTKIDIENNQTHLTIALQKHAHLETTQISIKSVFVNIPKPSKSAKMTETLNFSIDFPAFVSSNLFFDNESTTVTVKGKIKKIKGPEPNQLKNENRAVFGPFLGGSKDSEKTISVDYYSSAPSKTMIWATKSIYISQYGDTHITDRMLLKNTGPALEGPYNPIDVTSTAIHVLKAYLPLNAKNINARDSVGHIYSTNVEKLKNKLSVTIKLRFPLAGGWKTDLKVLYTVPTSQIVQNDKMKVFVKPLFADFVANKLTVSVFLPEGSENVKFERSPDFDATESIYPPFLSLFNGKRLDFVYKNVVGNAKKHLIVGFDQKSIWLLSKPVTVMVYIAIFYALYAFISKCVTFAIFNAKKEEKSFFGAKRIQKEEKICKTADGPSENDLQNLKAIKGGLEQKSKSQLIKACENISGPFREDQKEIFAKIASSKTKKEVVRYLEML